MTSLRTCRPAVRPSALRIALLLAVGTMFILPDALVGRTQPPRPANPAPAGGAAPNAGQTTSVDRARVQATFARLPLQFEANRGQTDARVKFLARGSGYTLFLTGNEAVLALRGSAKSEVRSAKGPHELARPARTRNTEHAARTTVLRMKLVGGSEKAPVAGADELPGKVNYFLGNDPKRWRTNVPTFEKVRYRGVYPGIDLVYYGNQGQLEYDFIVAPGADPNKIRLAFEGAEKTTVDAAGDLVLRAGGQDVRFQKPCVYQEIGGRRVDVAARWALGKGEVGRARCDVGDSTTHLSLRTWQFAVSRWDRSRPLIIDPRLDYATYLGGSIADQAFALAADADGAGYVGGYAYSTDFPTSAGAFDRANTGGEADAFVAKLSPDGTALVYATYLGSAGADLVYAMAVDAAGAAYVAGPTSSGFPTTPDAFDRTYNGGNYDAYVAKISADGSALEYATYLGDSGDDYAEALVLDAGGCALVAGYTTSSSFPTTAGAFQRALGGSADAYVAKISADGSALEYATYVGDSGYDFAGALALDTDGCAIVGGYTASSNFPTAAGAFQPAFGGGTYDAFVAKLGADGKSLVYGTYLGGSGNDYAEALALDGAGCVTVAGNTSSTNFPTTAGAFQRVHGGGSHAFVARVTADGKSLLYATYLRGSGGDDACALAVDADGCTTVAGGTSSTDFPTTADASQPAYGGGTFDAFVAKLAADGGSLLYATYLGGSAYDEARALALDAGGRAIVAGYTTSSNFPTTAGAFQSIYRGGSYDAFVARFLFDTTPAMATQTNRTNAEGDAVDVQLSGAVDADGDTLTWGATGLPADLSISATGRITGTLTFTSAGNHTVTVTVTDNTPGGPGGDSASRTLAWAVTNTSATNLAFAASPADMMAGDIFTVVVAARVAGGQTDTGFTDSVTLAIGTNPGGGTLSGTRTVSAVAGVATFSGLSIDRPGTGYTLSAGSTGLTGATSAAFNVNRAGTALLPGGGSMEMVFVPAGQFLMGNSGVGDDAALGLDDEKPQHTVSLSGYWMAKYEVTRGQYRLFIDAGGYSNQAYWSADGWAWKTANNRTCPDYWGATQNFGGGAFVQTDNHPVVAVTYYEAEAFCKWAGLRLPTEAEWEKAARHDEHPRIYSWGDTWDPAKLVWLGNSQSHTWPVGTDSAGASPYGCLDMAGNVWEWCKDWYGRYPSAPEADPQGPANGTSRVFRGGSFVADQGRCRCAYRDSYVPPYYVSFVIGFRCASGDTTPTLGAQPDRENAEGDVVDVHPIGAADADGDTLRWSAPNGLPPGLSINASTGTITGTLPYTASAGSPYSVTVRVSDNTPGGPGGDRDDETFTWTITNTDTTPTLDPQPDRAGFEGETVDVQLTGAADVDGDTLTWSATNLPPDLTISGTGRITGTIAIGAATRSPYSVTVGVNDGTPVGPGGGTADDTFTWTVINPDTTPTLDPQPDRVSYEGQRVNVLLTGAADADGDPLTWSNPTPKPPGWNRLPPGLTISPAGRVTGTITNGSAGAYQPTVTVTDNTPGGPGGDSASRQFTWTVRRPTLTITSPNGGEEWSIGQRATVTWESAGVTGLLKIELSRNGGTSWQVLSTGAPNIGTFAWTVTGTQMTSQALVRVTSLQNRSVVDVSDHTFSILKRYGESEALFRLNDGIVAAGRYVSLPLRYSANNADVTAATLDVHYDPTLLTLLHARQGSLGTSVVSRVKRAGCVGLVITGFPAGAWERADIAVLVFQAAAGVSQGDGTAVDLVLPDTDVPGVEVYDRQVDIRVARAEGIGGTVHFGGYGDLNGNGFVDVGDVQVMENVLLGYVTFNLAVHDLNFNGGKDIGDLAAIIDLFLYQGGGASPAPASDAQAGRTLETQGLLSEADIDFSTGSNKITAIAFALKASLQAGEVTFAPPPGTPARDDLRILQGQMADGVVRVLAYSDTRTPLPSFASFHVRLKAPTSEPVKPERPSSAGSVGNDGALSNGTLVSVDYVGVPPAPVITSCVAPSTTEAQITWGPVSGAVSYELFRGVPWSETPIATVRPAGGGNITYRDARLEGRTGSISYKVRARNVGGRASAFSGAKTAIVLPRATMVQANALSTTQVRVSWEYASGTGATAFAIECKGSTGDWIRVGTGAAADRSKTVAVAAPGDYTYRVKATRSTSSVSTPASSPTITVLAAPTGLTAVVAPVRQVKLDWVDNSTGETGFKIERFDNGGTTPAATYSVPANTRTKTVQVPAAGDYAFRVRAYNSRGYSSYSTKRIVRVP